MLKLVLLGITINLMVLFSVFDINFRTPLLQNLPLSPNHVLPPASRVVLFVGDGLRADTFFSYENSQSTAPFLRSIIEYQGVWGISHTQVPTESRPGHVAIIAGIYEDPSAIFKGWQAYPTDFDSVFNRSFATFSWGSPDILTIFSGSEKTNITNYMYSASKEQLSGVNGSSVELNTWVLDEFENFLTTAENNSTLTDLLRKNKIVFFFHFLGIDISGHTDKPHSREYLENVMVTDDCIRKIHDLINLFYNDDERTSFIFTSDHGMTDWGSHGDGSKVETETPIVAWGAGIDIPRFGWNNDTPAIWGLDTTLRRDVRQADIAPLMSVLIGAEIPVNSVGLIPLDYLSVSTITKVEMSFLNGRQLKTQYERRKYQVKDKVWQAFFIQFWELNPLAESIIHKDIGENLAFSNVDQALFLSRLLCRKYLKGLEYYQNYFSAYLKIIVAFMFTAWILFLLVTIIPFTRFTDIGIIDYLDLRPNGTAFGTIDTAFGLFAVVSFFIMLSLPTFYLLHFYLGVGLWWVCLRKSHCLIIAHGLRPLNIPIIIKQAVILLIGLSLLVLSFTHRFILSGIMIMICLWPFSEVGLLMDKQTDFTLWFVSCFSLAMFPCLPTVGSSNNTAFVLAACVSWMVFCLVFSPTFFKLEEFYGVKVPTAHLICYILATIVVLSTKSSFSNKEGLHYSEQLTTWGLLALSFFFLKQGVYLRTRASKFINLAISLSIPFCLLSLGHEALFPLVLTINLFSWSKMEYQLNNFLERNLLILAVSPKSNLFRRVFFFLYYIILSFFGIGNIASLNSFDPSWVHRFLTVFSPFTMMLLIVFKTVIPMTITTSALWMIINQCRMSAEVVFKVILIYCDIMALYLFYSVRNKGSWLEIGTSLSHFIIMETFIVIVVCLYGLVYFIMSQKARMYVRKLISKTFDKFKLHNE